MNSMMHNYIMHFGKKGMKWGVRHTPIRVSKSSRRSKSNPLKVAYPLLRRKKQTRARKSPSVSVEKKSVKKMTDEELNNSIKRLEMEKKYKDLKKADISTGQKIMGGIMQKSVENIGTQLLTYGLGTAVNKALKSDVVNPKKGQRDKK